MERSGINRIRIIVYSIVGNRLRDINSRITNGTLIKRNTLFKLRAVKCQRHIIICIKQAILPFNRFDFKSCLLSLRTNVPNVPSQNSILLNNPAGAAIFNKGKVVQVDPISKYCIYSRMDRIFDFFLNNSKYATQCIRTCGETIIIPVRIFRRNILKMSER